MTAPSEHSEPVLTQTVTVRYFAAARAAAGIAEEKVRIDPADSAKLRAREVIDAMLAAHRTPAGGPGRLAEVVTSCSFLLNGVAVRDRDAEVPDGSEFDVLPPFAGG